MALPSPTAAEPLSLINEIKALLDRYLYLPEEAKIALALWIFYSHASSAFWHQPRLVISSPTKRSGKTTVLKLLELLVAGPVLAANASPAALFRLIEAERPTILLDEADTRTHTRAHARSPEGIFPSGSNRLATRRKPGMDQCTICSLNRTKYAAQRPLFSLTLHALERAAAGFIDEVRHELSHRSSAKAHKLLHSLGGPYRREQSAVTNATASTSEADEHALCAAWYKNQLHMQRIHDKPGATRQITLASRCSLSGGNVDHPRNWLTFCKRGRSQEMECL